MVSRGEAVGAVALRPFLADAVVWVLLAVVLFGLLLGVFALRALGIVGSET